MVITAKVDYYTMESYSVKSNRTSLIGIATLAVLIALLLSVVPASYSDADDTTEYQIYLDLGGKMASVIFFEDEVTDYGAGEWIEVSASSAKDALTLACEQKFGAGSIEFSSSGFINTIGGMPGNGICYYSDQDMTGQSCTYGISYYPVQFVQEADGWQMANDPIAAYTGESTTFAVVCMPVSFDTEEITYTFTADEGSYAMNWGTYDMYSVEDGYDLQSIFDDYFVGVYGFEYGTPSEPCFLDTEYSIYLDLGGTVSANFLGVDTDFGDGSWQYVRATSAKDALTAACDMKYGEGSLVYKETKYGYSIDTINGMSGNGIGWSSNENTSSYSDVYYYPVQYIQEDGAWSVASVTIPNYTGDETVFAVSMAPVTYDAVEHTFDDLTVQAYYDMLKSFYVWPGYGQSQEPFFTANEVSIEETSVTITPSYPYQIEPVVSPDYATNKNVIYSSSDETVAIVSDDGVVTAVSSGTATILVMTEYGLYSCELEVTVPEPQLYEIYLDLGGTITGEIFLQDDPTDYGQPIWVNVQAIDAKQALLAACDLAFGEDNIEITSSGFISTINGMSGNGFAYFADQAFTGESNEWGISYYPVQFIKEDDVWEMADTPIAAYTGESTTFAIVCQPLSFDTEAVDFTFTEDGGAYAIDWLTYDMYSVADGFDLQKIYQNYFVNYFGWEYGTPVEPFFSIEYSAFVGETILEDGLIYEVSSIDPFEVSLVGYYGEAPVNLSVPSEITYLGDTFAVTKIDNKAFYNCRSLETLDLGSVEYVGQKAFGYCTNLVGVDAGDSLRTVSAYAFYKCVDLVAINFDDCAESLRVFGSFSFYRCTSLLGIDISSYVTTIGDRAFTQSFVDENGEALEMTAAALKGYTYIAEGKTFVRDAGIPIGSIYNDGIFEYAVVNAVPYQVEITAVMTDDSSFMIPETVIFDDEEFDIVGIADNAFKDNKNITGISADYIDYVGKQAFYGCSKLESISLDNASEIKVKAFAYCRNLEFIGLSDNLTVIQAYTFYRCTSLTAVDLVNVEKIGTAAFYQCTSLETVDLGENVTTILKNAFKGCNNIELIEFSPALGKLGTDAFGSLVFYNLDEEQISKAADLAGKVFVGFDGELYEVVPDASS